MSLTHPYRFTERKIKNIIKENIPDKSQFYSTDGTMCFNTKKECTVTYELDCAYTASVCGTAFDYLARFLIAQKVNNNNGAIEDLVAGRIFQKDILWKNIESLRKLTKKIYKATVAEIKSFIESQEALNDNLLESSIVLAKLEHINRGGYVITDVPRYTENDYLVKQELKKLVISFKKTFLPNVKKDSVVVFNPHFGIGSQIAGGADADIYIDGTLYDFKVTKNNGWSSADVTQIIGYYILDRIAKKCNDSGNWLSKYKIDRVALYKVRYEEIAYFDVDELDKNNIEIATREICCCYLMNNLFSEHIDKYNIPLTRRQLIYDCSNQGSEELEWNNKNQERLSDYGKKRISEITASQKKLKEYLDSIDVINLLKEINMR